MRRFRDDCRLRGLAVAAPTGVKLEHGGACEGIYFFAGGFWVFHLGDLHSPIFNACSRHQGSSQGILDY
jgi:hypothetical protein